MKRCWIHIGMHKTGTTSVQVNLAKVKKPKGWRFLTVGGSANMGQALYAMFSPEPHKFHWFVKRGKTPEEVAEEGASSRSSRTRASPRFVISSSPSATKCGSSATSDRPWRSGCRSSSSR